ncbi:hypothetical protein SEA_MAGRITTE_197 [Microbacterium phage Magritte]|nr:hypothetical protein SEA_MAGRITTE_197 [Microbacterium phage Magritte]
MVDQFQKPTTEFVCEAKGCFGNKATHIYGPECERETGKLMYLCRNHAMSIGLWIGLNGNEPVECPTHGRLGKVKDYLILREM